MNASTAAKYDSTIGAPVKIVPSSKNDEEFNSFVEENPSGFVLLLDCAGDRFATISQEYIESPVADFIAKFREQKPTATQTVVLFADSYEAHTTNPYVVFWLHHCIENTDAIIFATHDEASSVGNFYGKVKDPNENPGSLVWQQACPFPRLHVFTFSSAMGQTLNDRSIIVPALTGKYLYIEEGEITRLLSCLFIGFIYLLHISQAFRFLLLLF